MPVPAFDFAADLCRKSDWTISNTHLREPSPD